MANDYGKMLIADTHKNNAVVEKLVKNFAPPSAPKSSDIIIPLTGKASAEKLAKMTPTNGGWGLFDKETKTHYKNNIGYYTAEPNVKFIDVNGSPVFKNT